MDVGGRIGIGTVAVDVDDRGPEEVLGVDVGKHCCETGLDRWKTVEVGKIACIVGKGVGGEYLFLGLAM